MISELEVVRIRQALEDLAAAQQRLARAAEDANRVNLETTLLAHRVSAETADRIHNRIGRLP